MSENRRERDLILAPNEYAFLMDETKGHVVAYVGPHKTSLANTDQPVICEEKSRRYRRSTLEEAILPFPFAEEGWYIVLENPGPAGELEHPKGGPNSIPRLVYGRKVTIPGPTTFPLWPGQVARVIPGHHLRSNQYLLVRVYNEEAARANWSKSVIKPKNPSGDPGAPDDPEGETVRPDDEVPDLTTGRLLVIKGTEVSFYIPPTGIEVVQDQEGCYVRAAVTLERLEYCILLDEDGNKRYIQGPRVVFPKPTEAFVSRHGNRKFKAIELNELSGIYLKVIAPYSDGERNYRVGEELFITGREQMIYFPRPEHAVIKYGDREIHYAVAIPAGEARYVLDRLSGEITLKRGPCMFLPDPRREVVVRRVLEPDEVQLWFPGNTEALAYNLHLKEMSGLTDYVSEKNVAEALPATRSSPETAATAVERQVMGDDFRRSHNYTPPRTITLYDKYEGAVTIEVFTGYAVQVVSRSGDRKVSVGPQTYLLEYDESLETIALSTGTPKSDHDLLKSVYLRVLNNQVSDVVRAETRDLCQVSISLSYRVSFTADPARWFNVEDYVKYLTDQLRSVLRKAIKRLGVESFYTEVFDLVRDTVLGTSDESGQRPGRLFEENGMHVYDVDVLDLRIGDEAIAELLVAAQHSAVEQTVELTRQQNELEATERSEAIKQQIARAKADTFQQQVALQVEQVGQKLELELTTLESRARAKNRELESRRNQQEAIDDLSRSELARERARQEQQLQMEQIQLQQRVEELRAHVQAVVDKAEAVSPDLVAALQAFGDRHLAEKMAKSMAPLAILGGESVADALGRLLKDTPLEKVVRQLPAAS